MKKQVLLTTVLLSLLLETAPVWAEVKDGPRLGAALVPGRAVDDIQYLAKMGSVTLPSGMSKAFYDNLTRREMALLTMQALSNLGLQNLAPDGETKALYSNRQGVAQALFLKHEFAKEIDELANGTPASDNAAPAVSARPAAPKPYTPVPAPAGGSTNATVSAPAGSGTNTTMPAPSQPAAAPRTTVAGGGFVPEKAYSDMQFLVNEGIVTPPAGVTNVYGSNLSRQEMAVMTMKALNALGMQDLAKDRNYAAAYNQKQGALQAMSLRQEFKPELENMGMNGYQLVNTTRTSPEADDAKKDENRKFKISGEVRYNFAHNYGDERFRWNDSLLRTRLYLEARINDDWHAFSMIGFNKHFLDEHGDDSKFEKFRFYVRGITGDTVLTAGWYGYLLGEGNIYDTSILGVTANFGSPVNYELTAGRTERGGSIAAATAAYKVKDMRYGAGIYGFGTDDDDMDSRMIWNAYANYVRSYWRLGAMYLGSNRVYDDNNRHGFVLTAGVGRLQSWEPGTDEFMIKYYHQPKGTYVAHTMTGLANYMDGFKGLGATYYRTLFPNVVWGMEYYRLKDLLTNENGNTFWTQVSYYF